MRRRGFAFLLAASMAAGSLFGCKKGGEEETTAEPNVTTEAAGNETAQTTMVDMNDLASGDYGKLYYAPVDEAHVAGDKMSRYIDNEVLIVVKKGTTEEQVGKLAEKYHARIVGAIEVSGDYQLQLETAETKATLENKLKDIETEDIVVRASLNYVAELSGTDTDGHAGFKFGEKWKEDLQNYTDIKGLSWGIEAINVMGAWEKLQNNKDRVKPVNLGLVDCGFEVDHEDLKGIYAEVFYDGKTNGVDAADRGHGTHVSGTMAANCDNLTGICGVYPYGKGRLYGVSLGGDQKWGGVNAYAENKGYLNSIMSQKIAYAELIVRNVKVINQSQGFNWYVNKYLKKDDQGNEYVEYDEVKKWWDDPLNFFDQTRIVTDLSDFFQRMIDNGYDFVIVTGAGNDSHPSIGHLDARYASWLTLIPRMVYTEVYDRIIVVGSVNEELQESWFTNGGSRVDIYAPGENIYSTYPTNEYASGSGTSMAAPHVAGVAAMVWSANNSLNGKQVKKAITENFSKNSSSCHMVDALRAVEYALAEKDTGKNTNAESGGVLCFVVEEGNETNRISNAAITLVNAETAVPYETVTDAEGHFEIMVPEGRYNLFVSAQGYEDYEWPKTSENLKFIEVRNGQINYLDRDIGDWIKMKRSGSTVNSSDPADENGEQPTKADPFGPGTGKTEETSSDPLARESNGYIIFGHYEQDNNTGNGKEPIEWEILDENANGKLLISRYVLDAVPFNNEYAEVTWETSSLREWLNKDFLNEAFTKDEQALIPKVRLENSGVEMPGGNATEDQVFCLSLDEAAKYYKFTYDKYSYFGFKKELITLPTEYAKAHGLKTFNAKECIDGPVGDEYWMDGYAPKGYQASIADLAGTYWWLRTMGWDNDVCAVFPNGFAGAHYESGVSSKSYGVRPVLWISNDAIKGEDETEPDAKPNLPEPYDGDGVAINAENFPDERFRSILLEDYDEDGNRVFSKEELEGIKRVEIDEENISSLQGIEFFYNLQRLKCGTNKLTSLDISHNPKLKYLSCSNNPLSSLDVSRNTALEELYYSKTGLKEVDVSKNANLKVLYCMDNEMTSLDVSHNPKLKELGCRGNNLTSLDLSKNTELEKLYCSSNLLTTLDLSHNPKLKQLHCQVNELQALDPSHNPLLENIECFRNQLMELDLSNNPDLKYLDCGGNQLKSLDVSLNPALINLDCGGNQLMSLDMSRNEELKCLLCAGNQITDLDLSNNKQLTDLEIDKKTRYSGLVPNVDIELREGSNVTRIKSE